MYIVISHNREPRQAKLVEPVADQFIFFRSSVIRLSPGKYAKLREPAITRFTSSTSE
jgi:hypothetical protein